jgi:acetyl esterase
MPELHPEAQRIIAMRDDQNLLPEHSLSTAAERERLTQNLQSDEDPPAVGRVRDTAIPGLAEQIPVRIYEPDVDDDLPVVVFYHGGGFRTGNRDTHDALCRVLASAAEAVVVSVEYRLAPEHRFPDPLEDCYAALEWADEYAEYLGGDPERLGVAGDSAGGNLATATTMLAEEQDGPDIAGQLLMYPMTNHGWDTHSHDEYGTGYIVETETIAKAWDAYLRTDIDAANPYASPLRAPELGDIAPARIVTCEFDPLRDNGQMYAERLDEAGRLVEYTNIEDMFHGCFQMVQFMDQAHEYLEDIGRRFGSDLR